MQLLQLSVSDEMRPAARLAVECLQRGGVVLAPTETVYGLMTKWGNEGGYDRIFQMKRRPPDKLLQMLASSLDMAEDAGVAATSRLRALAEAFWPGPLTVVCDAKDGGTIGLRIPDHPFVLGMLRMLGHPLAATSANQSGHPPATTVELALADLDGRPDAVFDAGPGGSVASTVVLLTGRQPSVIRQGAVTREQIEIVLGT